MFFKKMNLSIHTRALARQASVLFTVAMIGLFFSCCTGNGGQINPDIEPDDDDDPTEYQATVEMSADIVMGNEYAKSPMRIHLGEDNTSDHSKVTQILWTAGDEVACWNADEKRWAPYVLTSGANTTTARFQGKAVHKDDNVQGQAALNITHSIFPLSATVRQLSTHDGKDSILVSPGDYVHSIYFMMPGTQHYQSPIEGNPTFGTQYNVMTGTRSPLDRSHVLFRSTGGVLLLRIKGSTLMSQIYRFKIISNLNEKLWGTFTAAIGEGGESTVDVATDINGTPLSGAECPEGDNTLILDCSQNGGALALSTTAFTNFYFVVPYGVFSEGFTILIDKDGIGSDPETGAFNDGKITTTKNNTIIQSDIKVMPALELTENVTLTWDLDDLYSQGTVEEF